MNNNINNDAAVDAIIVAAGSGARLGHNAPKAFVDLCGKPILYYSLKTFCEHPHVDKIILVVPQDMTDHAKMIINKYDGVKNHADKISVTAGGDARYKSVQNGVSLSTAEYVMIHDAARPFVTHDVINSVADKKDSHDCVITATPEVDTVREIGDREKCLCGKTVDREKLMRVGTPQLFKREILLSSFAQIKNMNAAPTDEAALLESLGIKIAYAWGDAKNFKITTQTDLNIARAIIYIMGE